MKIKNHHERIVTATPERIAALLADFDRIWPTQIAPAPRPRGQRLYDSGPMLWQEHGRPGAARSFRVRRQSHPNLDPSRASCRRVRRMRRGADPIRDHCRCGRNRRMTARSALRSLLPHPGPGVLMPPQRWRGGALVADTGCAAVLAVRQADGSQIAGAMKLDGTGRSGLRK